MKYCPYCGTVLVDSAVSFCMECGKKLPIKDEERGISQNNDNEADQETAKSGIESQKEKHLESIVRKHRKGGMLPDQRNSQRKRNAERQNCSKRKASQQNQQKSRSRYRKLVQKMTMMVIMTMFFRRMRDGSVKVWIKT